MVRNGSRVGETVEMRLNGGIWGIAVGKWVKMEKGCK